VPAVPEILDVAGGKGVVKVLGHRNADEGGRADGHVAETGEIAIQVEIVRIHRHWQVNPPMWMVVQQQPGIGQLVQYVAKKLIFYDADNDPGNRAAIRNFRGQAGKAAAVISIRINWPHEHCRQEKAEPKVGPNIGLFYQAIADF